ncbi:amidohydrolase family protein [Thermodesulfobacteriota bacterium]
MTVQHQHNPIIRKLKSDLDSGKLTRRDFLRYAILLGLSGTVASRLAGLLWPRKTFAAKIHSGQTDIKPMGGPIHCFDAHVHCGIQDMPTLWTFNNYLRHINDSPIRGAAMFPFPSQIYDRWNPDFTDTPAWQQQRRRANAYLLTVGIKDFEVFPYLFIWNDFALTNTTEAYCGVKWHRHANEPKYHYDDPRCLTAIEEIRKRNIPVVFEEELANTVHFVRKLAPDIPVIIPHMGFLNGGYRAIVNQGLFELPNVYTDTCLASSGEMIDYINNYGEKRILFGSDFPFGDPISELEKVLRLPIPPEKQAAVAGLNFQRLMSQRNL